MRRTRVKTLTFTTELDMGYALVRSGRVQVLRACVLLACGACGVPLSDVFCIWGAAQLALEFFFSL